MNSSTKAASMSNSMTTKANAIQVHTPAKPAHPPPQARRGPRPDVVAPRHHAVDLRPLDDGHDPGDNPQERKEERERGENETDGGQQDRLHEVVGDVGDGGTIPHRRP